MSTTARRLRFTIMMSPAVSSLTTWPSALSIIAWVSVITVISTVAESGRIKERFERVCGQIGVRPIASAVGNVTAPPAARAYAVDPVGELTIRPSQR